ncbi:MAG: hypothetical protein EPN84_07660 [Legionella sp.]|nr:MAG: hypothetical protein EPN84_07660 [Legionella sp.]
MLEAERKILKLHQEAQLLPKPEAPQVPKAPKVLEVVPTTIELPLSSFTLTKLSLLNFEERMLHDKMKPSLEKILETKFNSQLTFFNNTTHLILSFADADNLKKAKINLAKWAVNNDLDLTYNTDTNKAAIGIRHDVVITMKPQFQISDLFEKVMNLSPAQVPALAM